MPDGAFTGNTVGGGHAALDGPNGRDLSVKTKSHFDEEVIMSKDVTYQKGKAACEILAEDMVAHITGDCTDINGLQIFNQDTRDFLDAMYDKGFK